MASTETDIAIIGAGFSGIGMAAKLKQAGHDDFLLLDRGHEVGGTWHWNTYPGCACDVPSHLYSFSFAPNPAWSQTYSSQPEIRDYLERVADDTGIRPHFRGGVDVSAAEWDEDAGRWRIDTNTGPISARVLIAGLGPLNEPKFPDVPGLDDFAGEVWHSARWNHDYDLDGKRVAAIGAGASAIQFVPEIAKRVAQLHVVQRTPPWIMPHPNRRITDVERRVYDRVPALQRLVRAGTYLGRETFVLGFAKDPRAMAVAERIARTHMRNQVRDPELLEKVTPDYTIGCKRILPSNGWYPALQKPNVEMLTGGIAEIQRDAILTGEGERRAIDAIVFGTGFQVTDMPVARLVRGSEGRTLDDHWHGSPKAYLGSTVAGFPNLFLLLGPNTGLGHSSMVYMIESQIAHVMGALRTMSSRRAGVAEVRPEAQRAYVEEIDERMEDTVWNSGCASWYVDETGRNSTLWPDWTFKFRRRAARFDAEHYRLAPAPVPAEPGSRSIGSAGWTRSGRGARGPVGGLRPVLAGPTPPSHDQSPSSAAGSSAREAMPSLP